LTKEHFSDCISCAIKGGGGWRKTFKVFPPMPSPRRKFRPVSLSDLRGYFKGLPEKQIPLQVNTNLEKVADFVPSFFYKVSV